MPDSTASTPSDPLRSAVGWLRWWWPALGLMIFIFFASTDLGAMSHQSRILGPLLAWLGFSEATAAEIVGWVRKSGHAVGYALLGLAMWRGWHRRPLLWRSGPWPLRGIAIPLFLTALYAASDEWHQSFVPSRTGTLADVLLDSTGAAVGLALLWLWSGRRGRGDTRHET